MKITKLEKLASIITGDIKIQPKPKGIEYRTEQDLQAFFNHFGIQYGLGSGKSATVACLTDAQQLGVLNQIVNDIKNDDNAFLLNEFCDSNLIKIHEKARDFEHLKEFQDEAYKEIEEGKYWEVITKSRTIIEITLKEISNRFNLNYEGKDIVRDLNTVKTFFKMDAKNSHYPDYIKGLITATSNIVNNIAEARNKDSSSHAPRYKPKKHHAKFILESAISLSNFLIGVMEYNISNKKGK